MRAVVHVHGRRGVLLLALGGLIALTGFDGVRAQDVPQRWDGFLEHLSVPANGMPAYPNGAARLSRQPLSRDGRWLVFSADAAFSGPPQPLIFRRDRSTGITQMLFGATTPNPPVISADGNQVAFETCESWWRPDSANICDVYYYDVLTGMVRDASTALDGTLSDGPSDEAALSYDGRLVAFRTYSTTLLPAGAAPGQLMLRDRDADRDFTFDEPGGVSLEVVSVSSSGEPGNAESASPVVSVTGRFVAFRSLASNLVPGDTNNAWDVFLRDRETGETRRINVGPNGEQATPEVDSPAISMDADGNTIVFASDDDLNHWHASPPDTNNALDVFVYSRHEGTVYRLDFGTNWEIGNGHTYWPTMDENGRYVSLLSTSTNVEVPVTPGRAHVYVYDRMTFEATRISLTPDGVEPDAHSGSPVISGDGSFVAFASAATNLTTGPPPAPDAIYGAAHFNLTPDTLTIPPGGGEVTATITAQAYVSWWADPLPWLQWMTPPSGVGSSSLTLSAEANPDPLPRTETITILGKTLVVTQEAGLSATSLTPSTGPMTGGTVVTITGTGFEPDMRAYVGGSTEVIPEFVSSTMLRVIMPAHEPGLVGVFLRTADFRWADLLDSFRYLDTTPPEITPYVNGTLNNGWYSSDVTVDWMVYDPESAITQWCQQNVLTTDTNGTTFSCTATSEGGSATVTSPLLKRDTTPPSIQLNTPGPTMYDRVPTRIASYTCSDTRSGVSSCNGAVPNGTAIDMTSGYHQFTVMATDAAGNVGSRDVTYAVSGWFCEPRPFGMAAWWPFEIPLGNGHQASYKDIVSGIDAVGVNTNFVSGLGPVGPFAISTASPNSYVNVGTRTALERTNALTLSAWILPAQQSSPVSIIAGREGEYLLARFSDGTLRWSLANTNPGWGWVNTGYVIPLSLAWWTHVVLTYDGTVATLYVNGLPVHSIAASGPIGDAAPALDEFRIGARQEPGNPSYFIGGIDDLQVLDRALAAAEVERIYLAGEMGLCGPRNLTLTLTPNPLTVTYGTTQNVELVATLRQAAVPHVPQPGRSVTITRYDVPIGTGVTDENGEFRLTTSVSSTVVGTSIRYEATHSGDFYFSSAYGWQELITQKAVPVITWPTPAPIVYGSALGSGQLNATANTGGNFLYTPAAGAVLTAGTHTLSVAFTPWAPWNYTNASGNVALEVTRAMPTVQVTGGTFTYDGTAHAASGTVTGLGGASLGPLTFTYNGSSAAPVNAGTYTVVASYAGEANYTEASATTTLTIEKATPVVSATGGTFTYDNAPHAATGSVTGVGGASLGPLTFTYSGSSDVPVNAGSHVVVASYAGDANYVAASATTTLTIEKATPVVSATGGTFTYDETPHAATGSVTGVGGASLSPLTFTYNGSSDAPVNAGTYAVVASFAGDANYTAASAEATLTIDKATPIVSATGGTFVFDGAAHPATGSVTGVGEETLGPLTFAYNGSSDAPVNAGIYAVVASFAGDANYAAASADTTLTINTATPTVSATGGTFAYDAAAHAATGSVTGVGGASLSPLTFAYNGSSDVPVTSGSYDVVASYAGDANYAAASATATLTITKATPTVSTTGGTFTYDGAPHPATGSVTGVGGASLGSPSFTYNGSSEVPVNAGTYAVVASFAGNANYEAASANSTVTIGKAAAVLQWASPSAIVYGTALGGAQLNATSNVAGTFAYSPVAGSVLPAGAGRPLSGTFTPANPANYTGGSVATTIDVVPAPLMITANNAAKVFGAALPAFTATPAGFVNGDSLASLSGALNLSTTATAQSAVGTYPIVPSGLSSPNYAIAFVSGTLTIVRGAVVVNVNTTPEPSGNNQPMTFTATVAAVAPAVGVPGGTVRFFDGTTLLGTALLNAGVASLTTAGLDPGTRSIEARYDGDPSFAPGTFTRSHVIRSASQTPTVTVTSSRNPATAGQSVTLTASVSMSGGVTGSVEFYSGGTLLSTRTISAGQATFTTTTLATGAHAITARYVGNGTVPPARSGVLVQTVGASGWKNRSTTLALSSSSNPSTLGTAVTLTANVTGSISSMPTGRVLFMLDGQVVGDPAGVVITPVSGSTARATLTLPADLAHGRRNITATYRADANYKGSTAAITQTVN